MQHCYMILTDEITLSDLRTLGMCLSLIGSKISEDMVVQFEDSLLMKESPEEAVRPIVEDLFFNTRYCTFLMNFNISLLFFWQLRMMQDHYKFYFFGSLLCNKIKNSAKTYPSFNMYMYKYHLIIYFFMHPPPPFFELF